MTNEELGGGGGKYPSGEACARQTDAWCRPGGSPVGTLGAPAGLVRQVGSGDSGGDGGSGRTGAQSGEGGHTRDLRNDIGETHAVGFEVWEHRVRQSLMPCCYTEGSSCKSGHDKPCADAGNQSRLLLTQKSEYLLQKGNLKKKTKL